MKSIKTNIKFANDIIFHQWRVFSLMFNIDITPLKQIKTSFLFSFNRISCVSPCRDSISEYKFPSSHYHSLTATLFLNFVVKMLLRVSLIHSGTYIWIVFYFCIWMLIEYFGNMVQCFTILSFVIQIWRLECCV